MQTHETCIKSVVIPNDDNLPVENHFALFDAANDRILFCMTNSIVSFCCITKKFGESFQLDEQYELPAYCMRGPVIHLFSGIDATSESSIRLCEYSLEFNEYTDIDTNCPFSPRWGCSSTLLNDNEWYIYGGWHNDAYLGDLIVYNFITRKWKQVQQPVVNPGTLFDHSAVTRYNNKDELCWIFFGGFSADNSPLNTIWEYNFASNIWTLIECKGAKPAPRNGHRACMISNDQMLIFGGDTYTNDEPDPQNDIYMFTFSTMEWMRIKLDVPDNFIPVYDFALAYDNQRRVVYIHGGTSAEVSPIEQFVHLEIPTALIKHDECIYIPHDTSPLCKELWNMHQKQVQTDFAIHSNDGLVLNVHKTIIISRSPYFLQLVCNSSFADASTTKIALEHVDGATLELLVRYMYGQELNLSTLQAGILLICAADMLMMTDLKKMCLAKVASKVDVHNAQDLLEFAKTMNDSELLQKCQYALL